MTDSEILGHIVKYKLPSLIQSSPMWHRSQLQDLLTMVNEFGMPHLKKTLIEYEMTSRRWLKFNDMEYLVKQTHQNMSWKDCPMECATLFHYRVNMFMHQPILKSNGNLGIYIYIYVIRYELQHCGSVHAHIILWVNENDLQRITNETIVFIPIIFDKTTKFFIPSNDSLQLKLFKMVLRKKIHECESRCL
jgi:hypothetical protein